MTLTVVLGFGLVLGMQHATEPDHLAAVASLAVRERSLKHGLFHGIAWGIGHTLMLLLVAGAVGFLGWVISPSVAGHLEQVVGAMLIFLGLSVARRLWREHADSYAHQHEVDVTQSHAHCSAGNVRPDAPSSHFPTRRLPLRSVGVGMVHGLAGSAALALLAAQSMPTPSWMLVYIVVFGVGSILGMALFSGALAIPLGLTARHLTRAYAVLNAGVALFSIGLGGRLLFGVGG